jgi:tetratricopeptide (TPR) repeat protein
MVISIPVIVLIGFIAYLSLIWKWNEFKGIIFSIFILLAFGFPLFYSSVIGANLYGGWRQMLFTFPLLVVLSSLGLWLIFEKLKSKAYLKFGVLVIFIFLLIHPVKFYLANYPYQYTYFNPFVGGVQGAYGNYELDYYFTSYKRAYEFIDHQISDHPKIVAANFIIPEYYNEKPYKPKLIEYYNRSSEDWDYAIICNTFLDPYQLRSNIWPPANTIYTEEVDGKPIMAILKRETKLDVEGIRLMQGGDEEGAIMRLNEAIKVDENNESILINLARSLKASNMPGKAQETINKLKNIYPDCEWARDLEGEILMESGEPLEAIGIFQEIIHYNYKFYHSYINLAKAQILLGNEDKAIERLIACLRINPFYVPAYKIYGKILIDRGETELGNKMLEYSISGDSKYGLE